MKRVLSRLNIKHENRHMYTKPNYLGFIVDENERYVEIQYFKHTAIGDTILFGTTDIIIRDHIEYIYPVNREVIHR